MKTQFIKTTLWASAFACTLMGGAAFATDDFGSRFTDRAPAGFSDIQPNDDTFNIDDFSPEAIEPAAGDESDAETPESSEQEIEADQTPTGEVDQEEEISL